MEGGAGGAGGAWSHMANVFWINQVTDSNPTNTCLNFIVIVPVCINCVMFWCMVQGGCIGSSRWQDSVNCFGKVVQERVVQV